MYQVYTDGSHKGRWGSWAYIILNNDAVYKQASARVLKTGSTRMEIQAAIEALLVLPVNSSVEIFSDSKILIDAVTKKMENWKQVGWVSKSNIPVPNVDLFLILDRLSKTHQIKWQWIKAHAGNIYNERCDQMCTQTRLGEVI